MMELDVKKMLQKGIVVCMLAFLIFPAVAGAITDINLQEPVPVPYETTFFFGPAGEFTAYGLIRGLINIILAIAGLVAVFFVIIGGFRYVAAQGNEEQVELAKKTIQHAIIGIIVIILSFVIIRIIANALTLGFV